MRKVFRYEFAELKHAYYVIGHSKSRFAVHLYDKYVWIVCIANLLRTSRVIWLLSKFHIFKLCLLLISCECLKDVRVIVHWSGQQSLFVLINVLLTLWISLVWKIAVNHDLSILWSIKTISWNILNLKDWIQNLSKALPM